MLTTGLQTLSGSKIGRRYRLHTFHMKLCNVGLISDFFCVTGLDVYIMGKILKTFVFKVITSN